MLRVLRFVTCGTDSDSSVTAESGAPGVAGARRAGVLGELVLEEVSESAEFSDEPPTVARATREWTQRNDSIFQTRKQTRESYSAVRACYERYIKLSMLDILWREAEFDPR